MKLKKAFNFYNGLFYNILYCLYNMMKLDKKKECLLVLCHLCLLESPIVFYVFEYKNLPRDQ